MWKKIITFLLLLICPILYSDRVYAATSEDGKWEYESVYDYHDDICGIRISEYLGNDNEVLVPAYIDGIKVLSVGTRNYSEFLKPCKFKDNVTSIELSEGITDASFNCVNLEIIKIPSTMCTCYNPFSTKLYCVELAEGFNGSLKALPSRPMIYSDTWNPKYSDYFIICSEETAKNEALKSYVTYNSHKINEKAGRDLYVTFDIDEKKLHISGTGNMYDSYLENSTIFKCIKQIDVDVDFDVTQFTSLPDNLFNWCIRLSKIHLPDTVNTIGSNTFAHCIELKDISGGNITNIGDGAFDSCILLESIPITKQMEAIGVGAFRNCESLQKITVPSGITQICSETFKECINLESIEFPNGVISIDSGAFYGCSKLTQIDIPSSVSIIGYMAFSNCSSLTKVKLYEGVSIIYDEAFSYCINLKEIELPKGINGSLRSTFKGCSNLKKIKINDGIKRLDKTFTDCISLETVELPKGIVSISAFENCTNLANIEIPEGVSSIGEFNNCLSLVSIVIPQSVDWLDGYSFSNCKGLKNVVISNNISAISEKCFYNCTNLEEVIIPINVTAIASDAFDYCDKLIIYGAPGSYAESYAKEKGIEFVPHDHSIIVWDAEEPTCEKSGHTAGKYCSVCGYILDKGKEIPPEHSWGEWSVEKEATETEEGLEVRYCNRNPIHKETRVIPRNKSENNSKQKIKENDYMDSATQNSTESTTKNNTLPQQSGINAGAGVGTLSSDGRVLTDTQGKKWKVASFIDYYNIKKNLAVADKKSGGKYKIISVIKRNGKVTGGKVSYLAPYNISTKKATIPKTIKLAGAKFTVVSINEKAFKDCKNLASVTISENVTSIGARAFNGCSKLKTVTIKSSSLKSIGKNAFKGINAKAKFKLPKKKLEKYTKMIRKAGVPKKATFTK